MRPTIKAHADFIPNRFREQVALVVGGAQGIGKAIAVRLAREGAQVIIADIDRKMLLKTAQEIRQDKGEVRTIACNVRREPQVKRMVSSVIRRYERIDVLMQIAGVAKPAPFLKTSTEHYDWILDTNVKGSFLVARAVLPHMIKQRRGKMVFMASTNSWDAEAELALTIFRKRVCSCWPRPWRGNSAATALIQMLSAPDSSALACRIGFLSTRGLQPNTRI